MSGLGEKTLSVVEAIQSRRTIFNFKLEKPAREEIEEILDKISKNGEKTSFPHIFEIKFCFAAHFTVSF